MKKQKAVLTILGIQNATWISKEKSNVENDKYKANYYFEGEKTVKKYYNTLSLLIDRYSSEYKIIPIYTKDAKYFNKDILSIEGKQCEFNDQISLIKENEYFEIFQKIDMLVDKYDEIIVDLTHGFRHIPILAIIDLVIQNFKKTNKIEKILFAKEIVKPDRNNDIEGKYEIVDLKEYLDIANISFVLSSFENNYTISNHIKTTDKNFQELINMLSEFTEHIMANSLINLFKGQNSLVEKILKAIESIKKHKKISPLLTKLKELQEHLKLFIDLKEKREDIQLFELAKIVNQKGYYLNAITLLDEAIGWYCAHSLCQYSDDFKKIFKKQINNNSYKITSNAKNIVRFAFNNKKYKNELKVKDIKKIQKTLKNIQDCEKFSKDLIVELANNRNDLAHANNQKKLDNIKNMLKKLFERFQTYCIDRDILRKKSLQ